MNKRLKLPGTCAKEGSQMGMITVWLGY